MFDLCLVFPRENRKTLFASSKVLAAASPYWKAQLATKGFNENMLESLGLKDDTDEVDSDLDSDENKDETCKLSTIPTHLRTVPIYGSSYKTYHALLTHLYTSQVNFAPLSSPFPSRSAYLSTVSIFRTLTPSLPPPCSPKSLYILSHFLSIQELSDLALKAYVSSLTLDNALNELFSKFVQTYEEIREEVLKWVCEKDRWEVLRKKEKAREWRERIRGEEGVSTVELEILLRLTGIE
ncbi:uncharacterized protein JCM6883_001891 [Sporobolomyces salmoneus]|uniref:uncharacterized protein n=1 Tax=Sporobolomyces salmoneus TaxID=183962 RepID=UPI00316B0F7D